MSRARLIIILAATKREGYQYAHRAGIAARNCRIPIRGGQVAGVRAADIHVLPSFKTAPHRHSILRALKQNRGVGVDLRFLDVEMPAKAASEVEDQGDGMGPQLSIEDALGEAGDVTDRLMDVVAMGTPGEILPAALDGQIVQNSVQQVAEAVENLEEIAHGETSGATKQGEDVEAATPRRRRTRCAECGELRFPEDHECPAAPPASPRDRFESKGFF